MILHTIYTSFGIIFTFFQLCNCVGFFRSNYVNKYGRKIHQEVAKCGATQAVGLNERVVFTSDPSYTGADIHYINVPFGLATEEPITTDNPTHPLDISFPNSVDIPKKDGKISSMEDMHVKGGEIRPALPIGKANTAGIPVDVASVGDIKAVTVPPIIKPRKVKEKGFTNRKSNNKETTTTAKPHKPHWSDQYLVPRSKRKLSKEESPQMPKYSPRFSSATDTRGKRESLREHDEARRHTAVESPRRYPRSIYSNKRRKTKNSKQDEEFSGKADCKWTFTMKKSCNKLVAHITRFKTGQMKCNEQYLHFKGQTNERIFCDSSFMGAFAANGRELTVEHVKAFKSTSPSDFEGYVTCQE